MKKAFFILCISAVVTACGGSSSDKSGGTDSTQAANQTAKASNSDADTVVSKTGAEPTGGSAGSKAGEGLLAASDCNTCHKVDTKLIGPAFQDVAAKYEATDANIETLAKKVIAGGKGNWGDIPMTPHPALSLDDAKEMVKYVLSLKK
ncbi:c-type cytochrome [Mucilaginibacter aquaedulcis]|uniref:c-type cytochrome n=1 Tax=Mucilaginibacter aquaedulcis TaxID=1187081 RepID=UPI0025B4C482|nr:c-type cytochrome [Mucilaginibacter aquaedulcis]MDN3547012.1 c-type cytochrome [Mucilaginibacter aquaedulcis]